MQIQTSMNGCITYVLAVMVESALRKLTNRSTKATNSGGMYISNLSPPSITPMNNSHLLRFNIQEVQNCKL